MSATITGPQLRALQSLASQCFPSGDEGRAERLAWAGQEIGRPLPSFCALRADEAARLIELLKTRLGQPLTPRRRRPRDREAAMAAGTHGRKGVVVAVEMMAGADDLAAIQELRQRVGMSDESFANWLGSSHSSPTRGRRELRTVADCNRTRWALRAMWRRAG